MGAEEKFKQIKEAFNVLSDRQKRLRYDDSNEEAKGGDSSGGAGRKPNSGQGSRYSYSHYGDQAKEQDKTIEREVRVSLEEILTGSERR